MSQLILPRGYLNNVATLGEINPDDEVINSFFRIVVPAFSAYGALPTDILSRSITQNNPDAYRWPGGIGKRGFYFGGGGTAGVATIPATITATTSFALLSIVGNTQNAVIIGADRYEFGISSGSVYGATRLVGDGARVTHVSASVAPGDAVLFVRKNGVGEYLWVNGALVSSYTTTLALITNPNAQIIDSRSSSYLLGSYIGQIEDTLAERVTSPLYTGFLQKSSRRILYFDVGGGATDTPSAASSGSFSITGSAANGIEAKLSAASSSSYALTGSNAAGLIARASAAGSSSYTITGVAASGVKESAGDTPSAASSGSFTISGVAASGARALKAAADSSSYTLTGSSANGLVSIGTDASSGSYTITGVAAEGQWIHVSDASSEAFVITGVDAIGVKSGAISLTQADLDAIATAVWADATAVAAHAKLDAIIARLTC